MYKCFFRVITILVNIILLCYVLPMLVCLYIVSGVILPRSSWYFLDIVVLFLHGPGDYNIPLPYSYLTLHQISPTHLVDSAIQHDKMNGLERRYRVHSYRRSHTLFNLVVAAARSIPSRRGTTSVCACVCAEVCAS